MKRNDAYWIRRSAQRVFGYMQGAENTADQISKLYRKASRYLSLEMEGIFEKYQTKYGLTDAEAKRLLNTLQDKTDIEELVRQLKNMDSGKNKKELLKVLEAPAYQARIERLQQLQNQIDLTMQQVYEQEKDFSTNFYVDLANDSYYRSMFDIQHRAGIGFSFSHINQKQVDKVLGSKWYGKNYSARIWGNTKALAQDLKEELLIDLITGRTEFEVSKIISNKFAQGASVSRRLVRTESSFISNQMEMDSYKESGIEWYRFVATLDLKTSKICASLDGKLFPVSGQCPGKNCPPMHPWCRSTTIAHISDEAYAKMKRRAFNHETGKTETVPATMTYDQWYKKYVKGKPQVEAEEKKVKNYNTDKAQHQRYREVLVNVVPESFERFQDMKYNNPDKWKFIKLDYKRQNELIGNPELKLPNAENAIVPEKKFSHYLFGGEHPEGIAKGEAFTTRLGYNANNWEELKKTIRRSATKYPATFKGNNGYGDRYEQKIVIYGKNDTPANVIVGWTYRADGTVSMSSTYIKEVK